MTIRLDLPSELENELPNLLFRKKPLHQQLI